MKKITVFIAILFLVIDTTAQGKYAGTKKAMIGQTYTELAENLTALKGWTFMEGGLATSLEDPERIVSDVFKKGTTYLVFFSIMEDTASGKYKVMDVVEITGVTKGWTVHGSFCRQNEKESNYIIAWGKQDSEQYMKTIRKAWKFNPDKRRFEIISIKGIDCENIGC